MDLRDLQNPEPILSLAEAANQLRGGDTVRVLADDQWFANDFCAGVGVDLDILSLRCLPTRETELTLRVLAGAQGMSA